MYSPNNPQIYLAAEAGTLAGIGARDQPIVDDAYAAEIADAFAQAVDTAWGPNPFTQLDVDELRNCCEAMWFSRAPIIGHPTTPASYGALANEVVALVRAGTAQVVAEGIDPNAGRVGGVAISAAGGSVSSGTVVFSNSNNVTFGIVGSTVTATVAAGAAATINVSAGTTSNNLSAMTFSNSNGVSFGLNNGTITASIVTSLTNINISAGTKSANVSAVTFSNSNNVSFGFDGSNVTALATVSQSTGPAAIGAGTQLATSGTVIFENSNGITFGMSGSSIVTASYTQSTGLGAVAAGTQTATSGTIVFSNSNNVTFGLSGSSVVTASVTVASTQGSIKVSAGTTSSNVSAVTFSNANNVSFGFDGSNVTASASFASVAGASISVFSQDADFVTNFSAVPGAMSLQKVSFPMNLSATQLIALLDLEGASNSSGAMTLSHAIYTLSGSTASLASSASRQFTWSSGSVTSASSVYGGASGTRYRTIPVNYSMTPGDYLFAWQIQTSNNGSWTVIGRAAINVVGGYDGVETTFWLNGTSASTFATAFPGSIVATDTGYVRTGVPAMRQPGAILVGTGV